MAKEKVQPFESVKAFLQVQAAAEKANGLLKANQKWFEKRFGTAGGSHTLPDGKLTLTAKEPNGKDSTAYKAIVESIEEKIRSGNGHQMSKDEWIAFFEKITKDATNPQKCTQKVEGTLSEVKENSKVISDA